LIKTRGDLKIDEAAGDKLCKAQEQQLQTLGQNRNLI